MTFEEVVDQALAMLQRRGRVTYRLLKRQFDLDDEALEDLKLELIKGQRLAVDEEGEVLVWTGAGGTIPESAPPPPPPPQQRATQDIQHPLLHLHPLTLLPRKRNAASSPCCSVTWWTQRPLHSARPGRPAPGGAVYQDLRQGDCPLRGPYRQYLGDGLLVYFGYPLAHEDDAQRAVRAGLGMVEALGQLNTRLERERCTWPCVWESIPGW